MSSRYERRKQKREIQRKLKNRAVRKIVQDEIARGGCGTEIYRFDAIDPPETMYFNVSAMRTWANANLQVLPVPPDQDRAKRLVDSGAVDPQYILDKTIRTEPQPILICRDVRGGDVIVDGGHRFVAFCLGCAQFDLTDVYFPGYVLERADWEQFIVPPDAAKTCGFV